MGRLSIVGGAEVGYLFIYIIKKLNTYNSYLLWCSMIALFTFIYFVPHFQIGPLRCWPGGLCLSRSIGDMDVGEFIVPVPYVKQIKVFLFFLLDNMDHKDFRNKFSTISCHHSF